MRIDDRWSVERDSCQWILTESYMGQPRTRDGVTSEPQMQHRHTYHGRLDDAMSYILDKTAGECEEASDLRDCIREAEASLCDACKHMTVADFVKRRA